LQRVLSVILVGLTLSAVGCGPTVHQRQASFVESEYVRFTEEGTGVLVGQAFLKTRAGDVKYAAGNEVVLNPVTSYSTEWFNVGVKGNQALSDPDPRVGTYTRTVVADGEGRFEFRNLPPGDYYVATAIFWEVPSGAYGSLTTTGDWIGSRVTVRDGETTRIIVSS